MNALRLAWVYLRLGVINELQYRANFLLQMLQSALSLATALAGLAIIFAHTDRLGGWMPEELIALLGVYFLVGGAINFVLQPSMQRLMEDVRQGTLDFTLTKPEDSQLLVSIRQVQVWKAVDVVMGVVVLAIALARLGETIGIGEAVTFAVALLSGGAIVYGFWIILATLTFWFVKVDNILVVFQSMYQAGRWPVGIYPPWLRWSLTLLVPVAFATTVPAEALTGRLNGGTLVAGVALAAVMLVLSRWFWKRGVKRYSGASA
ncbi:MAG: ABC transporter permease [Anaerolineae bacterium]